LFEEYGAEESFEDDELAKRLIELREELRERFEVGKTLAEQLSDAIDREQYELAARLRDEIAQRGDDRI
jgi:protein-arginine kinase activator protein McsA